jgi:CHAT domain-containing protein/Flp pilus assembly protein TadD
VPNPPRFRDGDFNERSPSRSWPRLLTLIVLLQLLVCLSACLRRQNPQAVLDRTTETFHRGNVDKAAADAEMAYHEFRGLNSQWAWEFTILRATILNWSGMSTRALALLLDEPYPPENGDLAVRRHLLESSSYASAHKFSEAEAELTIANELCSRSPYPACAGLANGRGMLKMKRGHFSEAQPDLESALKSFRVNRDEFAEATVLLNLSWSTDEQTHYDEALDWADAARKISLAKDYADIAQAALGNMGWAYYKLGDPEKAEGMFLEATHQAERLGQVSSQIGWLTNVGWAYLDEGQPQLAEEMFRHSSDLARKIESAGDLMDSLTALAFVSEQTGKLDDAQRYADEALKMAKADGNGRDVVYPELVEGRLAARRNDTSAAEADFHEVEKSADTPVFLKWEAERSLARLYENKNDPRRADAEYRTALSTFESARCGMHERVDSRLPFLSNAARIYEDYIHFLVTHGRTLDALRVADYTHARTMAEGLGRPCKPAFAPDLLNAVGIANTVEGTILFYALGQDHSYLWVITPHEARMFPLAANQVEIDAAVQRYRKKLEGPPEILAASDDGSVLYRMLVAPAEKLLKQSHLKGETVFVIPDGGLNSLNFETLLPQPKRYWIEDVTIVNAASLRMIRPSNREHRNLDGKLLLIGDPVMPNAGAENSYPELPNAPAQMRTIGKYFPGARLATFSRNNASPGAYLNNHPEEFSYIHFVAHGTASRMNPLDSAIILSTDAASGTGTTQDDSFKLYAREIIGTHRLQADLVTISACYSTGKRTYSGEGLVGLSWAFLRAGAHNVVAALWDVSDASAPELIDKFYGGLKSGQSPGAALRAAKLSLLHGGTFQSPFYWGPFQLYTGS